MDNWQPQLTELGKRLQAQALAQRSPAMMGLTGQSTAPNAARYQIDLPSLQAAFAARDAGGLPAQYGNDPGNNAGRWVRFTGRDGTPLVAWEKGGQLTGYEGEGMDRQYTYGPNQGYFVFSDPGDMGGGWLGAGHESVAMNGRPYDELDANGNYVKSGAFDNWQDDFLGPAGALAVIAMPFAAAASGLGAAGAAGAEAAGAAGAAGAAAGTGGLTAAELAALETAAGSGLSFGAPLGAEAVAAYGGLQGAVSLEAMAAAMGMTPEALAALGAAGTGAAGAAAGQLAGTAAGSAVAPAVSGAGSSLIPGIPDKLLEIGAGAAVSALGGSGSTAGGTTSLQDAETQRQAKVQAAVDAINKQFGYGTGAEANKTARESMYTDLSSAVRDTAMRDLDRQYGKASNANTFGLARSGLLGGSVDAESGGELQDLYGEGRLKATQSGVQAASDLRLNDEKSRQNLISLAQTGLDTGTASTLAQGSMGAAADLAKSQASGATVGRLFDDLSQAYVQNQTLKARYPNGLPTQTASYGSGSLFGTNRYTGTRGA